MSLWPLICVDCTSCQLAIIIEVCLNGQHPCGQLIKGTLDIVKSSAKGQLIHPTTAYYLLKEERMPHFVCAQLQHGTYIRPPVVIESCVACQELTKVQDLSAHAALFLCFMHSEP